MKGTSHINTKAIAELVLSRQLYTRGNMCKFSQETTLLWLTDCGRLSLEHVGGDHQDRAEELRGPAAVTASWWKAWGRRVPCHRGQYLGGGEGRHTKLNLQDS
jgi:hypothetical protein